MRTGTLVAERFEIESLAGTGGMASVYRARDVRSGEPVALKVLRGEALEEAHRLVRESKVLAELGHPGIVRHVDHGVTDDGDLYLAMEWLEGEDLSERLARGPLTVEETLVLGRAVAGALGAAHARGLVHRDIKPSNLFLQGGAATGAKLLDFGIVRLSHATIATMTGTVLGTPAYMAPEQARGEKMVDARADVFSLGCVLFECLTGRQVWAGEHAIAILARILLEEAPRVREMRPDAPESLDALLARMLSKEAEKRPRDGRALAVELEALETLAGAAEAAEAPTVGITAGEQRVLSVVLVGRFEGAKETLPATVHAAIGSHGGRLERLADGSLLVVLSGSAAATDLVREAARCALALHALAPRAPVALATGRGTLLERLPVGEVADRAAALLRKSAGDGSAGVRVDEVSAGLLEARFDVGGDDQGLTVRAERETPVETRTLLGRPTRCVGRERELGTLRAFLDESIQEPVARAVVVTAPPGAGKSRLLHEFLAETRGREPAPETWIARGDPISAGAPFHLVAQIVRRAARVTDSEPLAVRQQKLRARLARHLSEPDLTRVSEFLGELAGAPFPDQDSVELRAARQDPRLMGDQMLRAFEDWLSVECAGGPVLLVLEDVHWGDAPSVRFVDAALRQLAERALMVVALGRPELDETFPRLWADRGAQEIRLGPLSPRAGRNLVRDVLGDRVSEEVAERLVAQSAGNAFYLEELIRAVAEGHQAELPGTVLAMAQARLEQLEPEARRLLRAASVFGGTFWRGSVEALLGGQPRGALLDERLAQLAEREFFTSRPESRFASEREYLFRHALVREAAYAALTDQDRRLGHRLAGEWLERNGEGEAVILAEHFDRGGEPSRAVRWYRDAAGQALRGNDLAAALARAERGVDCGAQGETLGMLRIMLAQAHLWRSEHRQEQSAALEAMSLLAEGGPEWCWATGLAVQASTSLGETDRLIALAERLRARVQAQPGADLHPRALVAMARAVQCLTHAGRYDLAQGFLEWLDERKEAVAQEPSVQAQLHLARAGWALSHGDTGRFLLESERAGQCYEQGGYGRAVCMVRENLGYGYREIGMHAESEEALRSALATARRMGLAMTATAAAHNLGLTLAFRGALEEALRLEEEALASASATPNVRLSGGARIYLARICLLAGDPVRAEREARSAVEWLEGAPPLRAYALGVLSEALRREGRNAEALEAAREGLELFRSLGGAEEGESVVRLAHARALAEGGRAAEAREAILAARERLMERARKLEDPRFRRSFLEGVEENAATLALAAEWSADG